MGDPPNDPLALTAATETFDEEVEEKADYRGGQQFRAGGVIVGIVVVIAGLADLLWIRARPGLDFGQLAVPWILMGLGIAFVVLAAGTALTFDPIAQVTIDDSSIELRSRRGKVTEFRWDDPKLTLSLSHGVDQSASPEAEQSKGWILTASGGSGHVWTVIGPKAGDGLIRRARRLGWWVSRDSTPWTGKYGERNVTVDVVFARTRPDDG